MTTHHTDSRDDRKQPTKADVDALVPQAVEGSMDKRKRVLDSKDDPNEIVYVSFTRHYAQQKGLAFQTREALITAEVRKAEDRLIENAENIAKERVQKTMGANIHIKMFSYEDLSGLLASVLKAERNGRENV